MTNESSNLTLGLTEAQLNEMVAALDRSAPSPKYQSTEHLHWLAASPSPSESLSFVVSGDSSGSVDSTEIAAHAICIASPLMSGQRLGVLAHMYPNPPVPATNEAVAGLLECCAAADMDTVLALASRLELPAFDAELGWKRIATLRTRILFPRPRQSARFKHARVTEEFLQSEIGKELIESIATTRSEPNPGEWTSDQLAWRLGTPHGRYLISWTDQLVVVSIRRAGVIPMGLILKCWVRNGPQSAGNRRIRTSGLLGAVARFHGTPLLAYRGKNRSVRIGGLPVWRRNRSSAKFLMACVAANTAIGPQQDSLVAQVGDGTFELLDSDAY